MNNTQIEKLGCQIPSRKILKANFLRNFRLLKPRKNLPTLFPSAAFFRLKIMLDRNCHNDSKV